MSTGSDTAVQLGPALVAVLVGFVLLAAVLAWRTGIGRPGDIVVACVRATVQLAAVSLLIAVVLGGLVWTWAFIGFMVLVATGTSAHRISSSWRIQGWPTLLPIGGSVLPVLGAILVSTAIPYRPVALLPIAGILVGGAMTATSLAGRRATEELHDRRGEYEAALAIGLLRRDAVRLLGKPAAALAIVPVLDQTRTVGLVTLPGAFVGVLLAGASPVQAGIAQLLVLISLVLTETLATVITSNWSGQATSPGRPGRFRSEQRTRTPRTHPRARARTSAP